jgi:hypothetical protein
MDKNTDLSIQAFFVPLFRGSSGENSCIYARGLLPMVCLKAVEKYRGFSNPTA